MALFVYLHGAQHRGVHMAAADDGEALLRAEEVAVGGVGDVSAAGVDDVHVLAALLGSAQQAGEAVLGVEDDGHALGQAVGHHGGQADAQIGDVAVLKFFRRALGDSHLQICQGCSPPTI